MSAVSLITALRQPARRILYAAALATFLVDLGACGVPTDTTSAPDCTHMTDTWASFAGGFFAGHCSGCHGFAGSQGGVESNASNIEYMVSTGTMPPGGGVSSTDRQRIVNWLGCGMP